MANPRRNKAKDKRDRGRFLALPLTVLLSHAYSRLSPYAVKLLLDIGSQYRGDNNGDLCAAWKVMQPKGWKSEETLAKAKQELLRAGFIVEVRKGYRPNVCSLYALTWQALDPNPKHDAGASHAFVFGAWKSNEPLPPIPRLLRAIPIKNTVLTTPAVVEEHI
jgi:hypothetical protein